MAPNVPTLADRRVLTLLVALALVSVPIAGVAGQQGTDGQSFVAVQGDQCTPIQSVTGNESVRSFYDYRVPFADNPYSNATGDSFSSEGTIDLQRANTSVVFLYTDTNGTSESADDETSLVFVHGNEGNENSTGGAATFDITGLPDDGRWAVQDDNYDSPTSYDNWSAQSGDTVVDWTWAAGATDGGAYTGLDDDSSVAVDPAFNADAALFGDFYDGTVDRWELLSAGNDGDVTRTELDRDETLYILAGSCEDFGGANGGIDVDDNGGDGDAGDDDTGTVCPDGQTPIGTRTPVGNDSNVTTPNGTEPGDPICPTPTENVTTTTTTTGGPVTTTTTENVTTTVTETTTTDAGPPNGDTPAGETPDADEETPPEGDATPEAGDGDAPATPEDDGTPADDGGDGAADGDGDDETDDAGNGEDGDGADGDDTGNGEDAGDDDGGGENDDAGNGGDGNGADSGDAGNGQNGANGNGQNGANGNGQNGANGNSQNGANGNGESGGGN